MVNYAYKATLETTSLGHSHTTNKGFHFDDIGSPGSLGMCVRFPMEEKRTSFEILELQMPESLENFNYMPYILPFSPEFFNVKYVNKRVDN